MENEVDQNQDSEATLAAKLKWVLIAVLGGTFLLGSIILIFHIVRFTSSTEIQYIPAAENSQEKMILVDVQGAVMQPGVAQLPEGSRIQEAISAAGGLSEHADQEYISRKVNFAAKVVDGTKLYLPYKNETNDTNETNWSNGINGEGIVNINTASKKELEGLPGVGPVTAEKIIAGRPYGTIEELLERKILGKSTFEKTKEKIRVY